jgi:hypothetical protein
MKNSIRNLFGIAVIAALGFAQPPVSPWISGYVSTDQGATNGGNRWNIVDDPLTITLNATDGRYHIGCPNCMVMDPNDPNTAGNGLKTAGGNPKLIWLNDTDVAQRVEPPSGPGPCGVLADPPTKTPLWATDADFFYVCTLAGDAGWVWARTPLVTTW